VLRSPRAGVRTGVRRARLRGRKSGEQSVGEGLKLHLHVTMTFLENIAPSGSSTRWLLSFSLSASFSLNFAIVFFLFYSRKNDVSVLILRQRVSDFPRPYVGFSLRTYCPAKLRMNSAEEVANSGPGLVKSIS